MSFRKEVRDFISEMYSFCAQEKTSAKLIEVLKEENASLRRQNELLFNKLMARNFEEYAVYKNDEVPNLPKETNDPYSDESLAGDILDETEQPEKPGSIS